MNGKKGRIEIDVFAANIRPPECGKSSGSGGRNLAKRVWEFCKDDPGRVTFSFKVGLAVLLVSLLILFRASYEVFGTNIVWAILTVAIMFEYTVGATFNRGFNRALGSLLAGILAIAVGQVAIRTGHIAEPVIIGFTIFIIGALTSFIKQWPSLTPYEHGFRVILFTYCLIIISGYRMGHPIGTALNRLYAIAIGGAVTLVVNVSIFPIWAGEQLHKELVKSFETVADSLQECVGRYLDEDGQENSEFSKKVMDEFPDEPAFKRCRLTLNSSAKLDSLANSAKWEPPHGNFRHFFYPWSEYVKVGAVLRHCAYEVMALHGCLHSEIQAPHNLRSAFEPEIREAGNDAAELVRSLGKDISNMTRSQPASLLKKVHNSTERLQRSIYMHSYLLTSPSEPLNADTKPSLKPQLSSSNSDLSKRLAEYEGMKKFSESEGTTESYHETMKKQQRRLHSWPSCDIGGFEEEAVGVDLPTKLTALESTTALSLATFASLLIEFVARLDHLVEAVDELANLARFA
ncbi:hypothetical protein AMTRI_Chr02g217480 [Amborella trichopoda]|uniref:Aluminum-activated malate transporter n=1 Tax=Amborella trichopoda TaxID=13333 RepID=W1NNR8_AMBTC|nr:aluminum-activated malate transporter 9 [Amborella trichopoda]ERM97497.1 hypothetical protein AMTR_s00125p00116990 [Amborella trichopoda]|eukprot:XP_006830081.1 aluminum-activated malate transporter 9 [Amborella trichopoda]